MGRAGTPILIEQQQFYAHTTSLMTGVTTRTLKRWIANGRIVAIYDYVERSHRFTLDEINRIRRLRGYNELTPEQARTLVL
jgi:predicted site-specific integrase-resolvase